MSESQKLLQKESNPNYMNYGKEKPEISTALGTKLISNTFKRRFRLKKNTVVSIVGNNGEGKSYTGLVLSMIADPNFDPTEQIVYHPEQLLNIIDNAKEKRYKVVMLDEAHTTVDAKTFMSMLNRAVNYVMSTFRGMHRLVVIVVAPKFTNIDKGVRELSNYYVVSNRVDTSDHVGKTVATMHRIQINHYNLKRQDPYLRKIEFRMKGDKYNIKSFEIGQVPKKIAEKYEEMSISYKGGILRTQIERLQRKMADQQKMAEFDTNDPDEIATKILEDEMLREALVKKQKTTGEYKMQKTDTKKLFNLSPRQYIQVEDKVLKEIKRGGAKEVEEDE